jgi:hypothetical protein
MPEVGGCGYCFFARIPCCLSPGFHLINDKQSSDVKMATDRGRYDVNVEV